MKTNNLGFPRIGDKRQLKRELEKFWAGKTTLEALLETAHAMKSINWKDQKDAGIDFISSNDFSLYDHVLDHALTVGSIPERFETLKNERDEQALYFAMARGLQNEKHDLKALEMTKWFDTNYHYIVPEFSKNQTFSFFSNKPVREYKEALALGIKTKPVLLGPVTFLLLGKEKESGFHRLSLLENLLPVYHEILEELSALGATYIQFDEPCLSLNLSEKERQAVKKTYQEIARNYPNLKIMLTSYFECYGENLDTVLSLPINTLHLDLVTCPNQLQDVLNHLKLNDELTLSLGLVNGRNIWINDFERSLKFIDEARSKVGSDRLMISASCSLLHVPYDLFSENRSGGLYKKFGAWLAFARQKLNEISFLAMLAQGKQTTAHDLDFVRALDAFEDNVKANEARKKSFTINRWPVKNRVSALTKKESERKNDFSHRQPKQKDHLQLPLFPTTTIGSFPQTKEVRKWRLDLKKNRVTQKAYDAFISKEIADSIKLQEEVGLDVLVHGEFERNDMVEYFGEKLQGFVFSDFGWVQSYGSRCVKPPIIYGDVERTAPMTVKWSTYAQGLTDKLVKGMLTGPVTILQWSFVRDDQPRKETAKQIALAIRDEVIDLEYAGIKVIQIDEPAFREGLPLRRENQQEYLNWAVECFRISASGVRDETQIHTHMCYSEFNDIIKNIADLDADVITIETSRSEMELLKVFEAFKYPNEIGPGVYDIHSPRVPSVEEMEILLERASVLLPIQHIWVNPDCGLKTRAWQETKLALENMVEAARKVRESVAMNI